MAATLKVQAQIRQNAEEISTYLSDLNKWEKSIKKRDQKLRGLEGTKPAPRSVRAGGGTVTVQPSTPATNLSILPQETGKVNSAAKHTYDIGYKKWENFDVDAALTEVETSDVGKNDDDKVKDSDSHNSDLIVEDTVNDAAKLTPASLARKYVHTIQRTHEVPKARGVASTADAEVAERERGNEEFKLGNFASAVKCYTKCLGMKVRNYVAFSNRAMAYLKMKEFNRAELDCSCALTIEPNHVKSLMRRATARNALGKHRAALDDLLKAAEVEPSSKQCRAEIHKAREMLRNAVNRAPMVKLSVSVAEGFSAEAAPGPELPSLLARFAGATSKGNGGGTPDMGQAVSETAGTPTPSKLVPEPVAPVPSLVPVPVPVSEERFSSAIDDSEVVQVTQSVEAMAVVSSESPASTDRDRRGAAYEDDDDEGLGGGDYDDAPSAHGQVTSNPQTSAGGGGGAGEEVASSGGVKLKAKAKAKKSESSSATSTSKKGKEKEKKKLKGKTTEVAVVAVAGAGAGAAITSYELERALRSAKRDVALLTPLIQRLRLSMAPKIFGNLMEADVLFEWLVGVGRWHLRPQKGEEVEVDASVVLDWFEAASSASSFSLLRALFTADQSRELAQVLDDVKPLLGQRDHQRIASVLSTFGL